MEKGITKKLIVVAWVIIIASLLFFIFKNTQQINSSISQNTDLNKITTIHKLTPCLEAYGTTTQEREDYFASSSPVVDGYQVLVNCSHTINSDYPDQKDEYFVVKDIQKGIMYYVADSQNILGSLKIIGVKNNLLFYQYCWEGCTTPKYFQLSSSENQKEVNVYPKEVINVLHGQSLPNDSEMLIYKNKAFFISAHKIQELDVNNFVLKDVKTIESTKIFGEYGEMGGEFIPIFEKKDNGLLFKIFENKTLVDSYFLGL